MSRPDDELPAELRDYLVAYRAVERPTEAARTQTWANIARQRGARVGARMVVAMTLLAASVMAWLLSGARWLERDGVLRPTPSQSALQRSSGLPEGHQARARQPARPSVDLLGRASEFSDTSGVEVPVDSEQTPADGVGPERAPAAGTPTRQQEMKPSPPARPVVPRTSEANPAARGTHAAGDVASVLAHETELLMRTQRRINARDFSDALTLLDEHEKRFRRGVFARERSVLRVQALCGLGRYDQARPIRERFLQDHQHTALARRMRSLCLGAALRGRAEDGPKDDD